jgi:hypothetical protein
VVGGGRGNAALYGGLYAAGILGRNGTLCAIFFEKQKNPIIGFGFDDCGYWAAAALWAVIDVLKVLKAALL